MKLLKRIYYTILPGREFKLMIEAERKIDAIPIEDYKNNREEQLKKMKNVCTEYHKKIGVR